MKKLVSLAVLMTSMGAVAQTPAAPPPMAKPGLTLTTPALMTAALFLTSTPRRQKAGCCFP